MGQARGFTLVETLIVVAIILLLAAIALPVYESATKRAERAVCMVNMRHICMGAGLYAGDYDGHIVPARTGWPPGGLGTSWELLLQPYLNNRLLLICNADPYPAPAVGCVSAPHSYGINWDLAMIGGYAGASELMDRIDRPAQTILFFEIRGTCRSTGTSERLEGLTKLDSRHAQGSNYAFVAGNVKWHRPEQTLAGKSLFDRGNHWSN